MRTFITDIIPKIQRFSQRLDDLTKLTNQHWVSLGDINQSKRVFIFRPNNQLLISDNGIVEKGSWEYLGNQSLLIETKNESYLLKHGFFDENIIALRLDSTDSYAFFVNETKYHKDLNNIDEILKFLKNKYLKNNQNSSGLGSSRKNNLNEKFSYDILSEIDSYYLPWGRYIVYDIKFMNDRIGIMYKSKSTSKYFLDTADGREYFYNFEDAAYNCYLYLIGKKTV